MDEIPLEFCLETYKSQLYNVEQALLKATENEIAKDELISLKEDLMELITLTKDDIEQEKGSNKNSIPSVDDEYSRFMAEMEKEGISLNKTETAEMEGKKCRAPHTHQWGDIMYHNAIISSVLTNNKEEEEVKVEYQKVKVLFINPTHEDMLPCPYMLESSCKFDDEKCKYSHGEIVPSSSLQDYVEPKFDNLKIGSKVLAKYKNKLWSRACIKNLIDDRCLVKFDSDSKQTEVQLHDVLPLGDNDEESETSSDENDFNDDTNNEEDVINMSLINKPSSQMLGEWEKHTRSIGSKLMEKMGYVIGTGLGKASNGIIDPVSAIVLPPGKSLDHCMELREKAGGDKNLFSVERKLKKLQKKQEKLNKRAYEREKRKKNVDVFTFLNGTFSTTKMEQQFEKSKHRKEIKGESSRNLNVSQLKIEQEIKGVEVDLFKIKESLSRHSKAGKNTTININLRNALEEKQKLIDKLKTQSVNIANEKNMRKDKKKLTLF